MAEVEVHVVVAEGLTIGPNDKLLIRVDGDAWSDDMVTGLLDELDRLGLQDRTLVLFGDAEFVKVEGDG